MKKLFFLAAIALLGACTLPTTVVRSGTVGPTISVKGAPVDAELLIDGLSMGLAAQFDGNPKLLSIPEGTHQVSILRQGKIVHTEKTFVSNGENRLISLQLGN